MENRLRQARRPWYVESSNTSLERSKLLENLVSKCISGSASGVLCVVSGSCLDVQRTAHEKAQNIRQNPSSWIHHAKVTRVSFSTLLRLLRLFKVILFGTTSSSLTLPAQLTCFRNQSSKTPRLLSFICSKGTLILLLAFLLLHKSSKGIFRGVGA